MTHQVLDARGTRIHCVEEGSGPLVLLVHGFPESWYSWRHQLPVIAEAGFRAVAIDVRGYGRSSAPMEVAMLSVPYRPPGGRRPTEAFAELGRRAGPGEEFYISYFQEPGRAEREAEIDVRSWLLGFYLAASAEGATPASGQGSIATVAQGTMLRDRFPAPG